jgi:hypothetical protein
MWQMAGLKKERDEALKRFTDRYWDTKQTA